MAEQWEYSAVYITANNGREFINKANVFGLGGWEMVSVVGTISSEYGKFSGTTLVQSNGQYFVVFKRRKPQPVVASRKAGQHRRGEGQGTPQ